MAFALDEDGGGIAIAGWRVRATKAPIIGDAAVEAATRRLGNVLTVPEILFGNSRLELSHVASGVTLSFDALDALTAWRREDLPPLKVTLAQQWQAARREEIERQQAVVLEYDWTYTTPYQGTLALAGGSGGGGMPPHHCGEACSGGSDAAPAVGSSGRAQEICTSLEEQPQSQAAAAQAHAAAVAAALGGPSGDPPGASRPAAVAAAAAVAPAASAAAVVPRAKAPAAAGPRAALPAWQPTAQQADRALLLSRDEPILFFADVPLYESELDDNGCSQLGVKVRVMPRCWLVLLRFWLRVDGCLVRLRETRLFCR
jgi:type 2A phosphatase activator TIP41